MSSKACSRVAAFLLSAALTVPMLASSFSTVYADSLDVTSQESQQNRLCATFGVSLSYTFTGSSKDKAGYAEGTITLKANTSGKYKLYWADNTKALDGYYPIDELNMKSGETKTVAMGYHTAIPAGATKVIATTGSLYTADADTVYDIPSNKRLSQVSGNLLYKFSTFSDVHIDKGNDWYKNGESNFKKGLVYSVKNGADYLIVSGDCITNDKGPDKEWDAYEKALSTSSFVNPVWESDGNHDLHQGVDYGLKKFMKATGTDGSNSGKPYFYTVEETTGDLFIFMAIELNKAPSDAAVFSDEQLTWVSNLIEQNYQNRNIFLVQHSPLRGFGAGDRMSKPYYSGLLNPNFSSNQKFKAILEKYPHIVFLSGHTHEDFAMDYNYSNENGTAAHMIHTPSLAGSKMPKSSDDALDSNNGIGFNSQAYITEVYQNEVIFYGVNITDEKKYPKYSYIMEGSRTASSPLNQRAATRPLKNISTDITAELSKVASILSQYYAYASYDSYQALKKLYYQYKGQTTADQSVKDEFESRINTLSQYTGEIEVRKLYQDYYFINNKGWSEVYAYAWEGSSKNASWPGVKMTKCGVDSSNNDIYKISFNSAGEFGNIIFDNGSNSKQTVDISLTTNKYNAFSISGSSNNKYTVNNFSYQPPAPEEKLSNTSAISAQNVKLGETLTVNASAKGGSGNYTYAVYYKTASSSGWTTVQDYNTNAAVTFKPAAAEKYDVLVKVKDSKSTIVDKSFQINVFPQLRNASVISGNIGLKDTIKIQAKATGGLGAYTYAVYYKQASETSYHLKQSFSTNSTITIKPTKATVYNISVKVKDSRNVIITKRVNVSVTVPENTSNVASANIRLGEQISLNCSAKNGGGNYTYAVYYKRNNASKWTLKQKYSTNRAVTIKPTAKTVYEVCVRAKDGLGNVSKKFFKVTVS